METLSASGISWGENLSRFFPDLSDRESGDRLLDFLIEEDPPIAQGIDRLVSLMKAPDREGRKRAARLVREYLGKRPHEVDSTLGNLRKQGIGQSPAGRALFRTFSQNGVIKLTITKRMKSAFARAVNSLDIEALRELLRQGVRCKDCYFDRPTPIMKLIEKRRPDVLRVLLEHDRGLINQVDIYGNRPLPLAVSLKARECVEVLLDAGANPELVGTGGEPPLMIAVRQKDREIERILREHGARGEYSIPETSIVQSESIAPVTPSASTPGPRSHFERCPKCRSQRFYRRHGAAPDGSGYAVDECEACGFNAFFDDWDLISGH